GRMLATGARPDGRCLSTASSASSAGSASRAVVGKDSDRGGGLGGFRETPDRAGGVALAFGDDAGAVATAVQGSLGDAGFASGVENVVQRGFAAVVGEVVGKPLSSGVPGAAAGGRGWFEEVVGGEVDGALPFDPGAAVVGVVDELVGEAGGFGGDVGLRAGDDGTSGVLRVVRMPGDGVAEAGSADDADGAAAAVDRAG